MSLRKAVEKVIEKIKVSSSEFERRALAPFIDLLEMALLMEESAPVRMQAPPDHRTLIELEKAKLREQKSRHTFQEEHGPRVIPVKGGSQDGVTLPTEGETPPDQAHTLIAGEVYTYNQKDNVWEFDQGMTEKMKEKEAV